MLMEQLQISNGEELRIGVFCIILIVLVLAFKYT